MDKKEEKQYSPYEVALKVRERLLGMYKNSELAKSSNSSHEIENGEEPHNDDSECPESLKGDGAAAEPSGKDKKKKKEGEPEHEQGMSDEENKEHDAAENDADEKDADKIEADEEKAEYEEDADKVISDAAKDQKEEKKDDKEDDKKKAFGKSESGQEYKPELMRDKGNYHENAQKSEEGAQKPDEDVARFCKYCGSEKQHEHEMAEKSMDQGYGSEVAKEGGSSKLKGFLAKKKNKKVEKMLGVKDKAPAQAQEQQEEKPSGMKGY